MSFCKLSTYFKVLAAVKYLYILDFTLLLNHSTILSLAFPWVKNDECSAVSSESERLDCKIPFLHLSVRFEVYVPKQF